MRGQDDLSRRRRLNEGRCPTHGIGLEQTGVAQTSEGIPYATIVGCPRTDCEYTAEAVPGTKLWEALYRLPPPRRTSASPTAAGRSRSASKARKGKSRR